MTNTNKVVRKNIRMSPEVAEWYEEKARELGVSQSNLMVMALSEYIKQDKTINMMANMETILKQLEKVGSNSQNE